MIYAYVQQSPWTHWITVRPVNERAHRRRQREAEGTSTYVKTALGMIWTDERFWHWRNQVPEKYRKDYDYGFPVRVKVDPAIFEVT